jgi:hypothetical protein
MRIGDLRYTSACAYPPHSLDNYIIDIKIENIEVGTTTTLPPSPLLSFEQQKTNQSNPPGVYMRKSPFDGSQTGPGAAGAGTAAFSELGTAGAEPVLSPAVVVGSADSTFS